MSPYCPVNFVQVRCRALKLRLGVNSEERCPTNVDLWLPGEHDKVGCKVHLAKVIDCHRS